MLFSAWIAIYCFSLNMLQFLGPFYIIYLWPGCEYVMIFASLRAVITHTFPILNAAKPLSHQGGVITATARRGRKTQNAEVCAVGSPRVPKDRRDIAVASPLDAMGSPSTPCHGTHFVHALSAHRGSAFPLRSEWVPWERRGFAAATQ